MKNKTLADWFLKNRSNIVMPNIQRSFVWKESQIEALFDSIYKGFFIGMFLIWRPERQEELIKLGCWGLPTHHDSKETQKNTNISPRKYIGIIDGQQRLSALSIGLYGSYDNKELYFNTKRNAFRFIDPDNVHNNWCKVSDILVSGKRLDPKLRDLKNNFQKAWFACHEVSGNIAEVTDIFTRVNKGGTPLSNSQMLLSSLTSVWGKEGRDNLERLRKEMKKLGLVIDYDFIIKASLFLTGENIKIKINQRSNPGSLDKIRKNWRKIEGALIRMAGKVSSPDVGFTSKYITSDSALISLAYMYYKGKKEENEIIKRYLFISFLGKVYGGSTDTTLGQVRKIMERTGSVSSLLKDDKFKLSVRDVADILRYSKSKYTALALILLYQKNMDFEQDHMHPANTFNNKEKLVELLRKEGLSLAESTDCFVRWKRQKDCLPNLAMLHRTDNREKQATTLAAWAKRCKIDRTRHYLKTSTSLSLKDFDRFYSARENLMKEALKKYFQVK